MQVQEDKAKVRTRKPQRGSRLLEQGVVHGNSPEGAYLKAVELRLREHLDRAPTFPEEMLIRRCARLLLQLKLLDRKASLSEHDLRVAAAAENRARLLLVTLNGKKNGAAERRVATLYEAPAPKPEPAAAPKPEPEPEPTLAEYLALKKAAAAPPSESEP